MFTLGNLNMIKDLQLNEIKANIAYFEREKVKVINRANHYFDDNYEGLEELEDVKSKYEEKMDNMEFWERTYENDYYEYVSDKLDEATTIINDLELIELKILEAYDDYKYYEGDNYE